MNDVARDPLRTQSGGHQNIPDSQGINFFYTDPDLGRLLRLYLGDAPYRELEPQLKPLGQRIFDESDAQAISAGHSPSQLRCRTRRGEALQAIVKHPDCITLERVTYAGLGFTSMSHVGNVSPSLVKYALAYLFVQTKFDLCCPVSMTDSFARTLHKFGDPALLTRYLPMLASRDSDVLCQGAMFMTEQATGSDVVRIAMHAALGTAPDGTQTWRLYGGKWFCSNADADLVMVLARPDDASSGINDLVLFLLLKTPCDGSRSHYRIARLKDELGTRSVASGEITLEGTTAYLIGGIDRGFHQIADMINISRLSSGVCAADLIRRTTIEALHIACSRKAFGRKLVDVPSMQRRLLKMLPPTEQVRLMFMQTAQLLPLADAGDAQAAKYVRILTPPIKLRACRGAHRVTGDATGVRGGTGYIEGWSDARFMRDAHLGSIWEDMSNIVAPGIARAVKHEDTLGSLRACPIGLLGGVTLPAQGDALLRATLDRVCHSIVRVVEDGNDELVRQAGFALYHITTVILMAVEGILLVPDHRRSALAHLMLRHKLLPIDPLALPASGGGLLSDSLVKQHEVPLVLAMRALPTGKAQRT